MTTEEKFKIDSNYPGIVKWGGFSLLISGIIAIIFFILVVSTQQTLPIPAKETLENPFRPVALFTIAIFGELLLLPGGLALYFSLRSLHKNSMIIVTSIWILCVPMFLASRGLIIAISQISSRYLETSSEIMKVSYIASAEMVIETQNLYAMMGLILLSIASIIMGTIMLKVKNRSVKLATL